MLRRKIQVSGVYSLLWLWPFFFIWRSTGVYPRSSQIAISSQLLDDSHLFHLRSKHSLLVIPVNITSRILTMFRTSNIFMMLALYIIVFNSQGSPVSFQLSAISHFHCLRFSLRFRSGHSLSSEPFFIHDACSVHYCFQFSGVNCQLSAIRHLLHYI